VSEYSTSAFDSLLEPDEALLLMLPKPALQKRRNGALIVGVIIVGLGLLSVLLANDQSGRALFGSFLSLVLAIYLIVLLIRGPASYLLTSKRVIQLIRGRPALSFCWQECQFPTLVPFPPQAGRPWDRSNARTHSQRKAAVCIQLKIKKPLSVKMFLLGIEDTSMYLLPSNEQFAASQILDVAQRAWNAAQ
jgi:hypothetical protein